VCGRDDDPTQHDVPRPHLYVLTYVIRNAPYVTRRVRVWADNTDEARIKAKALDPEYLATTMTPRIIR
jgi:hypothetical protein